MLMHDREAPLFSITFRSQRLMGFSNLQWKTINTDIPELLQSKFAAFRLKKLLTVCFCIFSPPENMVSRVSRSVHARFTVIDGLLPVIDGLLGVGSRSVHARFTLAILGPWRLTTMNLWWFQPWIPNDKIVRGNTKQQIGYLVDERKYLSWINMSLPAGLLRKFACV